MTTIEAADQATTATPRPAPTPKRRPGLNTETLALSALFVSLFAFAAAIIAVGVAFRAIDEHDAIAAAGGARAGAARVEVSLSEFMIMPGPLSAAAGSTLAVTNEGAVAHNLSVADLITPDLASGDQAELDVSGLAPGTYAIFCAIPGHKELGMETTLTIE